MTEDAAPTTEDLLELKAQIEALNRVVRTLIINAAIARENVDGKPIAETVVLMHELSSKSIDGTTAPGVDPDEMERMRARIGAAVDSLFAGVGVR